MVEIKAKVVLIDIEGTTTSISFVKDVLFPYAKQHTRLYLEHNWNSNEVISIVRGLIQLPQYKEFLKGKNLPINFDIVSKFVNFLIERDSKAPPLKSLQGLLWDKGFKDGTLNGHVYEDVPVALKRWHESGLLVAIYSSGSVAAQKLLFANTSYGNLLQYIRGHFDVQVGHKQEVDSYINIATELTCTCKDVVFITDVPAEAEAAFGAGMNAVLITRPGNVGLTDDEKTQFTIVSDFTSLHISKP